MEDQTKVPPTSELNPTGDDQVNTTDITDGDPKPNATDLQEGGKEEGKKEGEEGGNPAQKQSRETDAINAERRRRAKEREEARQREKEEQIRRQAVFDVESNQVTADELKDLSLKKVETEEQLFLVKQYRKAKASGAENPLAQAYRDLFDKQSAEKAEADEKAKAKKEAEEAQKAVVAQDQKACRERFGKSTSEIMKTETEFMELFGNLIDPEKAISRNSSPPTPK